MLWSQVTSPGDGPADDEVVDVHLIFVALPDAAPPVVADRSKLGARLVIRALVEPISSALRGENELGAVVVVLYMREGIGRKQPKKAATVPVDTGDEELEALAREYLNPDANARRS